MQLYMSWYIRSVFGFTFLDILYFLKYICTNIFHRRSLYTFCISIGLEGVSKKIKSEGIRFSTVNKINIFQCMGKILCVELQGNIWNSTQNILPLHWKMRFLYKVEISRDLTFKNSRAFLKQSPCVWQMSCYYVEKLVDCVVDCGQYVGASIIAMDQCRESISPKPVSTPLKKWGYTWLSNTK